MKISEETSKIIKQMEPMFNRLGELTKEETARLGTLFARWLVLNNEHLAEIKQTSDQTSKEVEIIKEKLDENETTIALMQVFLLENELFESFLVFADEVIADFYKNKKPNLTLVQ
jgi:hypothetical protein